MARTKRLKREVDLKTGKVAFEVLSIGKQLEYDSTKLPKEVQAMLVPYGINHKLGDAASGKDGEEAVEAMEAVWDEMMKGNFTVRKPGKQKVSKDDIKEKLGQLSGKEAAAAAALLEKLGISL